jgi:peptidoglycan biosynthesis protein MviN/MurJ (putative lipid II flippase)
MAILVYFSSFLYVLPRKIWQPWFERDYFNRKRTPNLEAITAYRLSILKCLLVNILEILISVSKYSIANYQALE